ncbi:hypothetical protein PR048_028017 [Dryococelus australis]|uniref:Uncharacterized protein n=1 Tax=Dryococelus australis TaxID=614101 RepID=A0ABQ9GI42_9NEOP|nr:hypothetical protein PR048_028017 [Dryococelus australis]
MARNAMMTTNNRSGNILAQYHEISGIIQERNEYSFVTSYNYVFKNLELIPCKKCNLYDLQVKGNTEESPRAKINLDLHHRKAEAAMDMKKVSADSCIPDSSVCTLSCDMQQATANAIASCLFKALNTVLSFTPKRKIVVWSDNCRCQNTNRLLFLCTFSGMQWRMRVNTTQILVSGYSLLAYDRDSALIETRMRVVKCYVTNDLTEMEKTARITRPFRVLQMGQNDFLVFQRTSDNVINMTKNNIMRWKTRRLQLY